MGVSRLDELAACKNRPRLHLLRTLDGLWRNAHVCWLLAPFGICALASPGADRFHHRQGVSLRRIRTGPRLSHRQLHCPRSAIAGDFVRLPTGLAEAVEPEGLR